MAKWYFEQPRVPLTSLPEADGLAEQITVSAGVAAYVQGMGSYAELLAAADRALYRAKESGRDRVVVAGEDPADERVAAGMEAGRG